MACRFSAVSRRLSPLLTLLVVTEILITSALKRFPAISNEVRVRVLGSKKRLMIVFPRNVGTFLISRSEISLKGGTASRMCRISSAVKSSIPRRSRPRRSMVLMLLLFPCAVSCSRPRLPCENGHGIPTIYFFEYHTHLLITGRGNIFHDIVGANG